MIYTNLTHIAMEIAFETHKNQLDKYDIPYIYHLINLAAQMDHEATTCVALLYGVVENSDITFEALKKRGFYDEIIHALMLMRRDETITYTEYIENIKQNSTATTVKLAALRHELDLLRSGNITENDVIQKRKYEDAILWLSKSK